MRNSCEGPPSALQGGRYLASETREAAMVAADATSPGRASRIGSAGHSQGRAATRKSRTHCGLDRRLRTVLAYMDAIRRACT
jgi:hypothetical protein